MDISLPIARIAGTWGVAQVATVSVPDANVILNILTVLLIVVFGPRYIRSSGLKKQIDELHAAIETKEATIVSMNEYQAAMLVNLQGASDRANDAQKRADRCEKEVAEWKSRYDEQSRYTAEPAFEALVTVLAQGQDANVKQHQELMKINNVIVRLLDKQAGFKEE